MPLKLSPTQVAFNARGDGKFNQPFRKQVDFLRKKLNVPTRRYDDIEKSAHDRMFMVAGAMKADLLSDFHDAINRVAADGKSIGWFKKEFADIVRRNGWEGWTGSETKAGRDWRVRTIYNTNLSASYSAGRYAQLTDPVLLKLRPNWRYNHNDAVAHPRPLHKAWDGTTLPAGHEWWRTHFTPNGYGCQCYITSEPADAALQNPPAGDTYTYIDTNGYKRTVANRPDNGWDYAPGAAVNVSLRTMVQNKLVNYRPAIARALSRDVNRYINANQTASTFAAAALSYSVIQEPAWLGFVENPDALKQVVDVDTTGYLLLLPSDAVHHVEKHHGHDGKGQRPIVAADYDLVSQVLADGDLTPTDPNPATGMKRFIAKTTINGEVFRCIFELSGKKLRAVSLVTMAIKTK